MITKESIALGTSWIAGRRAASDERNAFQACDPRTDVALSPVFFGATPRDIEAATVAARDAFESFARSTRRAELLERIADNLGDDAVAILAAARRETGLGEARLAGELERTRNQLRLFAASVREGSWVEATIDRGDALRKPIPKPDVRSLLQPLGPVAVFGASNFPLAFSTAGGDTASALAVGAPVVVKGHPLHPATGELAATAIARALATLELPGGAFSFLHAGGARAQAVGVELVGDPRIRAAGFTGSLAGGLALAKVASERAHPIPFFAEMGSTNPVFIAEHALARRGAAIADALFASFTGSAGQLCTRPGVVFYVHGSAANAFESALRLAVSSAPSQTMLSRAHRERWQAGFRYWTTIPGVFDLSSRLDESEVATFPALLSTSCAIFRAHRELREELFGPSLLLVACASRKDLLAAAGEIEGSLSASLWADAEDESFARELMTRLAGLAGRIVHEGVSTGVEVCGAMVHAGPFPACTRPDASSVGPSSMKRWCRPVAYQNVPDAWLPAQLREANPLGIARRIDGSWKEARP